METDAGTIINRPLAIGLSNGLVGHWTFDGKDLVGGKTARDISGQGNNGTLTNGPEQAKGRIGQALSFDGVNDRVSMGDPANGSLDFGTDSFSYGMWVYATANAGSFDMPWYKGGSSAGVTGYDMEFGASAWGADISDGTTILGVTLRSTPIIGRWVHTFAVVDRNANLLRGYVDGIQVVTGNISAIGSVSSATTANIGANNNSNNPFRGLIDDVRVYNRALSADEIKRLYNLGGTFTVNKSLSTGTLKDGLVGHWTFDGKDLVGGQTARDISGQGNNGTLTNGPKQAKGRIGQALNFDGSDDNVTHGLSLPKNQGTISHWVKPDQIRQMVIYYESDGTAAGTYNGFGTGAANTLEIHTAMGTTTWHAIYGDGDQSAEGSSGRLDIYGGTPVAGTWTHLVLTWNRSGSLLLYVNGVQVAAVDMSVKSFASLSATVRQLGRVGDGTAARHWDGLIDDVRVYNRALSADEIKRLYNMGR